jgi:TP901 family phage tail tape measure protein|nr:MAG TPA: minor tail protein [Caudoviricetes sp.]
MNMAGVEHSLTFQLAGKLASSLPQAFSSAGGLVGGLSSKLSELEAEASQVGALVNHRKAVLKASAAYRQAKAKLDELESEMSRVGVPTKKMAVAHQKAKDAVERCSVKLEAEKQKLDRIPGASASAESSIVTLRKRQKELGDQIDVTRRKIEANAKGMQRFGAAAGKMTLGIGAFKGLGAAASSVKSAISGPVQASMKMEDAMADLAKVSDFTPEGLERMKRELERMSLMIPMSADGLAQIAAAAAGAGVAQKDLLGFTEQAAKMAVAFDMTAEQAGTMMSKWQSGMKLSVQETYALADAVNGLSNNNAALASQIGDAIQRYGALGKVAGLSEKQTAALATSLIASGASSETAATGMKAFMGTLAKGAQLSDKQQAAFANIGIGDVKQLQKDLQKDAPGAILRVLDGLKKNIPEDKRTMYLNVLFGETGSEAIGPLLQNIEALRGNFDLVGDATKTAGSMEKEFAARAATTSNSLQLLKNSADFVARSFGDQFLGPIREGATYLGDLAFAAGEYVRNNKETVKTVLKVSAALGGMLSAAVAVKGVVYTLSAAMDVWRGVCALSTTAMKLTTAVGRGLAVTGRLLGGAFSFAGKALAGIAWGASRAAMIAWKIACVSAGVAAEATAVLVKGLGFAIKAAFASPVGLAVMALAGLVAGGIALYKNFDEVKLKVNELWAAFSTKFSGIAGFVTTSIDYVQSKVETVKSYFSNLTSWIGSTFFGTWGEAWSKVSAKFGEIFGGLGGLIKAPLNGVIGMVNGALSKLNALNIELPAMLGGGTIGFNIPEIPMLAEGGVVSSPTLAMIGEGSEPEAVMPLSTLPAISGAANNQPSVFNYSPVINVTGSADTYSDVKRALDEGRRSFDREFDRMMRDRNRLSFA